MDDSCAALDQRVDLRLELVRLHDAVGDPPLAVTSLEPIVVRVALAMGSAYQ